MNAIEMLAREPWVERLGLALLHFVWQGFSIAALYGIARWAMGPRSRPQGRYLLACAALAAMMAAPLATWKLTRPSIASPEAGYRVSSTPPPRPAGGAATTGTEPPAAIRATVAGVQPRQFLPLVVIVWLAGTVLFWARLAGGWMAAARMRSVRVRPAPPEWQENLRELGLRIGLSRPVRLLVSSLVEVPAVLGWLRPVVLVPVGAIGGIPAEHLEALLLHELAHIRRQDYLVSLLQSVAEALLFYHPAVWWVSGQIRAERELCCDDAAVSASGDALTYARALARWEAYRPAHSAALAATGGSLSARIARLLGEPRPAARPGLGPGVLAVALLLAAAGYGLFGQPGAGHAFRTASIEQSTANWSEPAQHPMGIGTAPDGRQTARNASLMLLIQFAYAVHDSPHWLPLPASQVIGGPDWINSVRYNIDAEPGANTDPKQIWPMWQTLLADRFQLRLHRETRELPVYILTAAKGGLRLPAAKQVECISFPPGTPPRHVPGKVDCGYVSGPINAYAQALRIEGSKVRMADLVRELALVMDRPVLDQTGFSGEFDLDLSFTADETLRGLPGFGGPGDPGGSRLPTDPARPNIITALEQQLGLKLEPSQGPVEALVIDRAAKPEENRAAARRRQGTSR